MNSAYQVFFFSIEITYHAYIRADGGALCTMEHTDRFRLTVIMDLCVWNTQSNFDWIEGMWYELGKIDKWNFIIRNFKTIMLKSWMCLKVGNDVNLISVLKLFPDREIDLYNWNTWHQLTKWIILSSHWRHWFCALQQFSPINIFKEFRKKKNCNDWNHMMIT